ncbi:MAG: MFS transporter [Pseudolabrys sp.]
MVIFASSLGTVFEWYDFYIYGTLAPILAAQFFSGVNPTGGFHLYLARLRRRLCGAPFGALFFGRLGDMIGRKYTFLITMTLMGIGTFFIGVLPSYASAGIIAPVILIGLRLAQGLALGGEYGGAAIYVAEHAPPNKRGLYTSWIQTTASSACSWPCCSCSASAPRLAKRPSSASRKSSGRLGVFRSCCRRSCSASRSGSGSSCRNRRSSPA